MAQYYTDFSEYTTGSAPSDFTSRWNASAWSVQDVAGTTGGKVVEVVQGSTKASFLSWDVVDSDSDSENIEILTRVRQASGGSISTDSMGVAFRGSGTSSRTGYLSYIGKDNLRFARYINNSFNLFSTFSESHASEIWYYTRTRANGTSLKSRSWSGDLIDEPEAWEIETTNSDISAEGWAGLFVFSSDTYEWDIFSVGTNGDTAPSSAPATGPVTPINPSITSLLATSARLNWEQG